MPPVLITAASALNKIHDATWWKAPLALPHLCFSSRDIWWPERCRQRWKQWCILQRGPLRTPESRNVPGPVRLTRGGTDFQSLCAEMRKLCDLTPAGKFNLFERRFCVIKKMEVRPQRVFLLRHLWTDKLFYKIWGHLFMMSTWWAHVVHLTV